MKITVCGVKVSVNACIIFTLNGVKKVNHKCREVQVEVTPVFRNVSQVHLVLYEGI